MNTKLQIVDSKQFPRILKDVSFSGERFLLCTEEGVTVGIVPLEDIEILEELEYPQ